MKPTPETLDCGHSVDCLDFEGDCTACDVEARDALREGLKKLAAEPVSTYQPLTPDSPEPIVQKADFEAGLILLSAQKQAITSSTDAEMAAATLRVVKAKAKEFEALRKSMTQPLDDAKKRIMDLFRPAQTKLEQAEVNLKGALLRWEQQQAEVRRQALAEAERVAREERERLAQAAAEQRAAGNVETAAATEAMALSLPTPALAPVAKLSGVSTRETWRAEVTNLITLCEAVVKGTAPIEAIEANMTFLNGSARALKDAMRWPGVRAVKEEGIVSR